MYAEKPKRKTKRKNGEQTGDYPTLLLLAMGMVGLLAFMVTTVININQPTPTETQVVAEAFMGAWAAEDAGALDQLVADRFGMEAGVAVVLNEPYRPDSWQFKAITNNTEGYATAFGHVNLDNGERADLWVQMINPDDSGWRVTSVNVANVNMNRLIS